MADASRLMHETLVAECRRDREPPLAVAKLDWRYHHMGIPTSIARSGERYLAQFKMYVSGFNSSPFGIEWMQFEADSPLPELIKTVPHVAFEVDDLDVALRGAMRFSTRRDLFRTASARP